MVHNVRIKGSWKGSDGISHKLSLGRRLANLIKRL